jgi:4-amino-4-deoxy-L-arabinose transferase-like glycosyltransferase
MVRSRGRWVWLPLLLTALVRALWLSALPVSPTGPVDAEGFHLLAINLAEGRGFAIGWEAPFCATAVRTPLYPLLLGAGYRLLGRVPERAVLLHVLLEVLTTAWVLALTRALLTARRDAALPVAPEAGWRLAWLAGVLYALNPITPRYAVYTLSETLLVAAVAASLAMTVRLCNRPTVARAALAALGWGTALLTKPNVQYLVLAAGVLVVVAVARRAGPARRWRVVFAFWIVLFVAVAPWLVRNRRLLGRWTLSTAFEENLARVSAVAVRADVAGLRVEPWTETWEYLYDRLVDEAGWRYGWHGWHPDRRDTVTCEVYRQRKHQVAAYARELVMAHLPLYLRVHLRGAVQRALDPNHRLWYPILTGRAWAATGVVPDIRARMAWSLARGAVGDALHAFWTERLRDIPLPAALIWWGLVLARWLIACLGGVGAGRLMSRRPIPGLLLAVTIAYHLVLPGPIAYERFYLPALPACLPFVVLGLDRIIGLQQFGRSH